MVDEQRNNSRFLSQLQVFWIRIKVFWHIFSICRQYNRNIITALYTIQQLIDNYKRTHGSAAIKKVARINNRYFWRVATPGYPSKAFDHMMADEVNRLLTKKQEGLRMVYLAITSKCPLSCEHCLEWQRLNRVETYSDLELVQIIKEFQEYPTTQVFLTGGEPLLRYQSILHILKNSAPGTDFWIITSGLGLTLKKANELKEHGLTGVLVSLDHHLPERHNSFRGYAAAYDQASKAVENVNQAGLVSGLSVCTTKEYTTSENLQAYMETSKTLGVAFVQMLEPKATGRYENKDVALSTAQTELLETIFFNYNNLPEYREYPVIDYPGYHQRRLGCFGAGNRFFYIDSSGYAHVCPFCANPVCKIDDHSLSKTLQLLSTRSCGDFQKSII